MSNFRSTLQGLPRRIRQLLYASILASILTFISSMLDGFGQNSFFLTPICAGLTLIYHLTILLIEHKNSFMRANSKYSIYSEIASIVLGFMLGFLWLATAIVTGMFAGYGIIWAYPFGRTTGEVLIWVHFGFDILSMIVTFTLVSRATWERNHAAGFSKVRFTYKADY